MINLFDTSVLLGANSFIPHGHCYLWRSPLVSLHVASDAIIAISYYSIPAGLVYFVKKRTDLPFNWIFLLFGAFIVLCGTTHVAEIWTLWYPNYWESGILKLATAAVSIATAFALISLIPKALALPSPAQLEAANKALEAEIVDRKKAEAEVRTLNAELEQRVEERTQELTLANDELQNYTTKLEQSNRELQDFATIASHDLQEPLRKIQAFGDRLSSKFADDLPEKAQNYLERMQGAAGRMSTLIEDLLAFSRVTTKAKPFKPTNLEKIIDGVISDLEMRLEREQGKVIVGDLPILDADSFQMRQLFQNLIANALKFHRPDVSPEVKISSEVTDVGLCEIKVADNGIGFDEKYINKIFTVFQRLHSRSEYEGTGIGLAVCRKIVERHNGTITATSTPGSGATFIVTLPLRQKNGGQS